MHFALKLGDHMPNFKDDVGHWVTQKRNQSIAFIFADFCLQKRLDASDKGVAVYGQGRVYEDVLSALKDRTVYIRNRYQGVALVWVIHFAPFDCGYKLHLHGWRELINLAVALKVSATLCGHTHQACKYITNGHVVYCAGSAGCVDSENDSRVHVLNFEIEDDQCAISRENFVWNDLEHEFVKHSSDWFMRSSRDFSALSEADMRGLDNRDASSTMTVRRGGGLALRNDAFKPELAGMVEHQRAVFLLHVLV
jgi:hypothetical protein